MTFAAGTRLGVYEITSLIGVGGMGEVYRATDTKLGREVAIKTLPSELANDRDRLARFEREAKLLATLNHAHIAAVYGLHEHEGTQFLAMELVEGETLERKLKGTRLPVENALRLALQIAEALEAAHEKGVVHRDLKPANIMVTPHGQGKVLDFGLAKAFSTDPNQTTLGHSPALSLAMTQAGLIIGTAGYMSPEQASGQPTDQRVDIWAFGVVLYEMLAWSPLFTGESVPHILADVLRAQPDWSRLPNSLHPRLKLLLEGCLEKNARNRYHSIADVRIEVEKVLSEPVGAVAVDARTAVPARSMASRVAISVVLISAGAAVAGIVGLSLRSKPEPAPVNRLLYVAPQGLRAAGAGRPLMAISPDGRRFVYNTDDGLYLRSMDDLEAQPIPGTRENLTLPFFSPDGQSVAYATGGQLKRVALSGGAPSVIADGVTDPLGASWGPDGTILYGQPQGIFRVSANGGTPELVIPAQEGEQLYGPELLPDGNSVLFSAATNGDWAKAQIVVQSLSTGKRTRLISGGSDAHYVASSGHLVYALRDELLGVAFDAATLTTSGGPVSLVQDVARSLGSGVAALHYDISNDGTLVYLNFRGQRGWTLVWVDRDGYEQPLGIEPCVCAHLAVSPDGTRVAFDETAADLQDADIWVWSLTERTRTRLTLERGTQLGALWWPDSTRIAYSLSGQGLFARPVDGTGVPEPLITSSNRVVAWAWLTDDELIFSEASGSSGWNIGVLAMAGERERRPLLTADFNEYRPVVSPDRRWLAYQSDESGQYEIYIRPLPDISAGLWQVSSGGGEEPKWSRDGPALLYLGPTSLMETAVSGGTSFTHDTPKAVLDLEPYVFNSASFRRYDVSPDGQRFLLPKRNTTGAAQFIVVTNWDEELKRRVPTE